MKKYSKTLAVIVSIATSASVCAQDFDKGIKAYVAKNYPVALKEWHFLAERGNAAAQFELGSMYREGVGVTKDNNKAVVWYRKSAEQGHDMGQFALGWMYFFGQGVIRNEREAAYWYRLAAEKGLATAQNVLAGKYQYGWGVIQDNVYAHMWYNIAASNGHDGAEKSRDEITKKMTTADISKAQELARECVRKQYKGC